MNELESFFFQYRNLLIAAQWNLMEAIAKECVVTQPISGNFINTNKLGSAATERRSLATLLEKGMIFNEMDEKGNNAYQVYDCFLSKWLERL